MKKKLWVALVVSVMAISAAHAKDTGPYLDAKKVGVKRCLPAVKKLADKILADRVHTSACAWSKSNPDSAVFSCSGVQTWGSQDQFYALSLTPTAKGECVGEYTQVVRFDGNCEDVRKEYFSSFLVVPERTYIMLSRELVNLHLLPRADGCSVLKHETILELK